MAVEILLTKAVSQLPTLTYPGWDDFGQISRTLFELEHGMFRSASVMADQMWRDDRFYAVMRKRLDALESVPLVVKAADERAKAVKIAEMLGGNEDVPGKMDDMIPAAVQEELIGWGILMGIAIGEQVWKTDDLDPASFVDVAPGTQYSNGRRLRWTSRIKVWNPQWLRWDWSLFRYRLTTAQGEITLPDVSDDPRSDGKWLIWCPYGYNEAWKKGLVRALAKSITRRGWTDRDWSRHNEKNGLAIDKAIVPAEASTEAKDNFFTAVADRNGETTVMCEQSADPQKGKFDLELVESKAVTWQTFKESKGDVNNDIAIAILGQNLTTEVSDAGSKAAEKGHENVARNYLRKDAGFMTCYRQQSLSWDAEHNYGDATLAPLPVYQIDPPEDQAQKADALNKTGLGLVAMKTAGAPIDDRQVLESAGWPTITVEEQAAREAVQKEEDAARAATMAPGNGGGGQDDGGADPVPPAGGKKKAGTAKMGAAGIVKRVTFAGLSVAVENPKGSTRVWREAGADGAVTGSTTMQNDYGFLDGFMDNDGEEVDCYLGPQEDAANVHVIHQLAAPDFKKHDENKVMLGFATPDAAIAAYAAHRTDGTRAIGGMSTIPVPEFKRKLKRRTGTGKIRAGAAATIQAISKLAARAQDIRTLAAKGRNGGDKKQLRYADGLIKAATMLGARSLAVDLANVKHVLDGAKDWKDLEHRLVKAYAEMDPSDFASAVQKARMMSNLGGQLSAVKQT